MSTQAMDILAVFLSFPTGLEDQDVDVLTDLSRGGVLELDESEDQELVVYFSLN